MKETIGFWSEHSNKRVKRLLSDHALKQQVKEDGDLWLAYSSQKIEPSGKFGIKR